MSNLRANTPAYIYLAYDNTFVFCFQVMLKKSINSSTGWMHALEPGGLGSGEVVLDEAAIFDTVKASPGAPEGRHLHSSHLYVDSMCTLMCPGGVSVQFNK